MPHGRPPMSTTTRLYGHFAYSTVQRPMPVPALMNALLERRGVDAIYGPLGDFRKRNYLFRRLKPG